MRQGCFPDCDILPIGKLGKGFGNEWETRFNREEQKTMMTLWCMFRSPLMIGAELMLLDDWTVSLLTNRGILALLKESCRGTQIMRTEEEAVWKNKEAVYGRLCVALFNLSDEARRISVGLNELGEEYTIEEDRMLFELWDQEENRTAAGRLEAMVPAHGVKVYRIGQ